MKNLGEGGGKCPHVNFGHITTWRKKNAHACMTESNTPINRVFFMKIPQFVVVLGLGILCVKADQNWNVFEKVRYSPKLRYQLTL